jgi:hypothetical protein
MTAKPQSRTAESLGMGGLGRNQTLQAQRQPGFGRGRAGRALAGETHAITPADRRAALLTPPVITHPDPQLRATSPTTVACV